eukprot:gene46396-57852_t
MGLGLLRTSRDKTPVKVAGITMGLTGLVGCRDIQTLTGHPNPGNLATLGKI